MLRSAREPHPFPGQSQALSSTSLGAARFTPHARPEKVLTCPTSSQDPGQGRKGASAGAHPPAHSGPRGAANLATNAHSLGHPHQQLETCLPGNPHQRLRCAHQAYTLYAHLLCHQPAPGAGPGQALRRRNPRPLRSLRTSDGLACGGLRPIQGASKRQEQAPGQT